jgi:hypothetical protein
MPTTTVAMVGTIMMSPSLDQMGALRSQPIGRRTRENFWVPAVGRLLTSPPSEPAPDEK